MDDTIVDFLNKQSVVTICCTGDDYKPYCFPCFFAFNSREGLLYFKTSSKAHHSALLARKPEISGSILPDKLNVLALKGVQFEGMVLAPVQLTRHSSRYYYHKYPLALVIPGEIYGIRISSIKMTEGAKGFGKKITWSRVQEA